MPFVPDTEKLREFYEGDYPRGLTETGLLPDDDFMYGQVLAQLRGYLRPGLRVLDLGCSIGQLSLYMAHAGCEVVGVDLARNAVEAARANAARLGVTNARFEALDFVRDWDQPGAFDFVLSSFVLEHVPDDRAFVERIAYALEPGGRTLIFTGAVYSSVIYLSRWFPHVLVTDDEVGHFRRYTGADVRRLMTDAGYTISRIVFLDSVLREWSILCKPIRRIQKIWGLPGIRRVFNGLDALLARGIFPGTVCVHAQKPGPASPDELRGG